MRGIEENYAVARAAQWGLLSLSDSRGNIIQVASSATEREDALLIGEIQLGQGRSLYSRFGDWFGYLSQGFFIVLILFYLKLSRRKQNN